jgi:hypothetical protein
MFAPNVWHLYFKTKSLQEEHIDSMDNQPKTRREKKKDQGEKGAGKDGKYSAKHVRLMETLKERKKGE